MLVITSTACNPPDISDTDVHMKGTDHVDTVAFSKGIYQFPDDSWILYSNPEKLGWNEQRLDQIGRFVDSLDTSALMIIHKGVLIYDWGATDEKYITQSMRKGLLNGLYGIYWDKNVINLDQTLSELYITDTPSLSDLEKTATVEQLLQSTSGIYHSALYEVGSWKRNKPDRGTHKPGEYWYYNNWGFNTLGTIFEKITSQKIGGAFKQEIAIPLQMQDFESNDVSYITQDDWSEKIMGNESKHSAYMFSTSARDMARFGLLYLNRGQWNNRQIISEDWIKKSWSPVDNDLYRNLKFGYLWWIFENGNIYLNYDMGFEDDIYFTSGNRGHFVFVIPYLDLVVVHRVYVKGIDFFSQIKRGLFGMYANVDDNDVYEILRMIRTAHPMYNNGTKGLK